MGGVCKLVPQQRQGLTSAQAPACGCTAAACMRRCAAGEGRFDKRNWCSMLLLATDGACWLCRHQHGLRGRSPDAVWSKESGCRRALEVDASPSPIQQSRPRATKRLTVPPAHGRARDELRTGRRAAMARRARVPDWQCSSGAKHPSRVLGGCRAAPKHAHVYDTMDMRPGKKARHARVSHACAWQWRFGAHASASLWTGTMQGSRKCGMM